MIIKSCDGSVAPPSCMYTQKLKGELGKKKKRKRKPTPLEAPVFSIGRCKGKKKKMGERGSSFLNEKHVSATALWPFPYTVQTEGRHHQNSSSVHSGPLTVLFFLFFWFFLAAINEWDGGKNCKEGGAGGNHTHVNACQRRLENWTSPPSTLNPCWVFFKQLDKCETSGHYCLDI